MTQAGESMTVRMRSSVPFYFPKAQLVLKNQYDSFALHINSREVKFNTQTIEVTLPQQLPLGAFTLAWEREHNVPVSNPKAVHIVDADFNDFSVVQFADLPTFGGDEKGDRLFHQMISEVNIINPDVVLLTGDIAYGGSWDQYQRLVDAAATFDAPVIAVAGNHEYEGWAGYLTHFVEPYHAVDYGPYKFISINSGHSRDQLTESQYQWLLAQFRSLQEQTPIVQIHHPVLHKEGQRGYVRAKAPQLVRLFKKYNVPIIVSGHWHGDSVFDETGQERRDTWDFPGPAYVVTTTSGADLRPAYSASPLHYGYRLLRFANGELLSYTYDYDGDGARDADAAASIPVGHLNVIATDTNTVTVKNDLNEALPNAKVQVRALNANIKLKPDIGRLVRMVKKGADVYYEVIVDIPARSEIKVTLHGEGQPV